MSERLSVTRPAAASPVLSGRALWWSFAAATTGAFMVNVDASVVNVALPVLSHQLGLAITTLQWVITSYLLVITGLLPVAARLADALGRRRVFVAGLALFVVGSILCALAPTFSALVAARAAQGIGASLIMSNVMAIVALTFPAERRGQALGMIGSVVAAGTLAGPAIGGLLTQAYGWPSIFWINVPVGLWAIFGVRRFVPAFPPEEDPGLKGFDLAGAVTFAIAASLWQFGLAGLHSWLGISLLAAGVAGTWLFVRVESRAAAPLLPLALFRIPAFSWNLGAGMIYWTLMMFPAFLFPVYLREELHWPVGLIGLGMIPQALGMILASPLGGLMADRIGVLLPGRLGLVLFGLVDVGILTLSGRSPAWWILLLIAGTGVAAGLFATPNNTAVLDAVPSKRDTGVASSVLAIQRNLGRATGVGIASLILSVVWSAIGAGANPSPDASGYAQWFLTGFHGVFWAGVALAAVGQLFLRDPRRRTPQEGVV